MSIARRLNRGRLSPCRFPHPSRAARPADPSPIPAPCARRSSPGPWPSKPRPRAPAPSAPTPRPRPASPAGCCTRCGRPAPPRSSRHRVAGALRLGPPHPTPRRARPRRTAPHQAMWRRPAPHRAALHLPQLLSRLQPRSQVRPRRRPRPRRRLRLRLRLRRRRGWTGRRRSSTGRMCAPPTCAATWCGCWPTTPRPTPITSTAPSSSSGPGGRRRRSSPTRWWA
jgi:translation initiation factor IF-2